MTNRNTPIDVEKLDSKKLDKVQEHDFYEGVLQTARQSSIDLGRFGLKNANDVVLFLNSAAGKSAKATIAKIINERLAMQEDLRFDLNEQYRLHKRILAALMFYLVLEDAKALTQHHYLIQQQIDKELIKERKDIESEFKSQPLENNLEQIWHEYIQEHEHILKSLHDVALEQAIFDKKYAEFEHCITMHDDVDIKQEGLEAQIQTAIDALTTTIEQQQTKIDELIENNEDDAAKEHLVQLQKSHLERAIAHDLLAVIRGEKKLITADNRETSVFGEAHYVLRKDQQIIVEDNQFYLLAEGETLTTENREQAKKQFDRQQPELLMLKQVINNNKKAEITLLEDRKNHLNQKQLELDVNLLRALNSLKEHPELSPPAASNIKQPKPEPTNAYRDAFFRLRQQQERPVSKEVLTNYVKQLPEGVRALVNEYLAKELNQVNPQELIPPTKMMVLLQNMSRLALNPEKPDIMKNASPTPFNTKPLVR